MDLLQEYESDSIATTDGNSASKPSGNSASSLPSESSVSGSKTAGAKRKADELHAGTISKALFSDAALAFFRVIEIILRSILTHLGFQINLISISMT